MALLWQVVSMADRNVYLTLPAGDWLHIYRPPTPAHCPLTPGSSAGLFHGQIQGFVQEHGGHGGGEAAEQALVFAVESAGVLEPAQRLAVTVVGGETAGEAHAVERAERQLELMVADAATAAEEVEPRFGIAGRAVAVVEAGARAAVAVGVGEVVGQPEVERQERGVVVEVPQSVGGADDAPVAAGFDQGPGVGDGGEPFLVGHVLERGVEHHQVVAAPATEFGGQVGGVADGEAGAVGESVELQPLFGDLERGGVDVDRLDAGALLGHGQGGGAGAGADLQHGGAVEPAGGAGAEGVEPGDDVVPVLGQPTVEVIGQVPSSGLGFKVLFRASGEVAVAQGGLEPCFIGGSHARVSRAQVARDRRGDQAVLEAGEDGGG